MASVIEACVPIGSNVHGDYGYAIYSPKVVNHLSMAITTRVSLQSPGITPSTGGMQGETAGVGFAPFNEFPFVGLGHYGGDDYGFESAPNEDDWFESPTDVQPGDRGVIRSVLEQIYSGDTPTENELRRRVPFFEMDGAHVESIHGVDTLIWANM